MVSGTFFSAGFSGGIGAGLPGCCSLFWSAMETKVGKMNRQYSSGSTAGIIDVEDKHKKR